MTYGREMLAEADEYGAGRWPTRLAWLSVAGGNSVREAIGNSVMPPWVRHQFPEAGGVGASPQGHRLRR